MAFKESNLQSLLTAYFRKNRPKPCPYCKCVNENGELKITKTNTFNFKSIRSNQLQGLWDGKYLGIMWKHSDADIREKPCDYSYFQGPGFLGICFYKPRKPKIIYFIDIDTLLTEIKTSGKKSINEERTKEIASKTIQL